MEAGGVPATKGSPFERLDGVVTFLGATVGEADVEGIEDEIPPVVQHFPSVYVFVMRSRSQLSSTNPACGRLQFVRSSHEVIVTFSIAFLCVCLSGKPSVTARVAPIPLNCTLRCHSRSRTTR